MYAYILLVINGVVIYGVAINGEVGDNSWVLMHSITVIRLYMFIPSIIQCPGRQ